MGKITACSFVYNEADKIEASMKSLVEGVDEFVIFDLESTDGTGDIAKKFTNNVFTVPYLLCGDGYKQQLLIKAKGDWLLWFYPDEVFSEEATKSLRGLVADSKRFNAFAFMRRERIDGIPFGYEKDGRKIYFGTPEHPNRQQRLIKRDPEIFYTELVHAEVHGKIDALAVRSEAYMEHRKSSKDQEFDNIRLYIWYKHLIFKYGDTMAGPYKAFIDSYKRIVHDSEVKNLSGDRKISLMEEFWWNWRGYSHLGRITLDEFKEITGIPYKEFLEYKDMNLGKKIIVEGIIRDKALDGKWEVT